jgi:integrase
MLNVLQTWAKLKRFSPRGFKSPSLGVRRYEEKMRRVHIEKDQIEALRARSLAYSDRRFGVFVALLIETGARKSELLERRWRDVNLDTREILAPQTKNGTSTLCLGYVWSGISPERA